MLCDRCGASPAFAQLEAGLTLCLPCANHYVLLLDARQDLLGKITPILNRWEDRWRALGLREQELRECWEAVITDDLETEDSG